jgi:hypothetical protein
MYDGVANQGMRCLIDNRFEPIVDFKIFDVRGNVNYQKLVNTISIFQPEDPEIH